MTARTIAVLKANFKGRDPYDQFVDLADTLINPQDAVTFGGDLEVEGVATMDAQMNFGSLSSSTQTGITLSATSTKVLSSYADDGNATLGDAVYSNILARTMLFKACTHGTIVSVKGQIKLADEADMGPGVFAGVQGYMEMFKDANVKSGGKFWGVDSSIDVPTTGVFTVDSGAIVAGLHAELTGAGEAAQGIGGILAGLYIDEQITTGTWGYGIYIAAAASAVGVYIDTAAEGLSFPGTYSTGAITFSAADDIVVIAGTAAALEFKPSGGATFLGFDTRNTVTAVTNVAITGVPANIVSGTTTTKVTVGITPGTTTFTGTATVTSMPGMGLSIAAPVFAGTAATVSKASTLYIANAPQAGGSVGVTAGYAVEIAAGAFLTAGAVYVTRAALGATNDRAMKISSTQATPAMADGYGVIEKELSVTGTATGRVCAESSWLNLGASAVIPSYTTVHNDGIYDGTATLTTARVAWGKYHCMLESNPADCALWELNFAGANSEIDAVFMVNDATLALGFEAGTPSQAATGSIPIFQTAGGGGGGPKYIYVYDSIA